MRVAAEPAHPAVRSIAQLFGRVDMAFKTPSFDSQGDGNCLSPR
jgi:hypothetical protein